MAGAGGWGDPLEREPARVFKDVRNEFLSREAARSEYGVVFEPESLTVDEEATTRMRDELRRARGPAKSAFVDRGPLPLGIQARD